MKDDTRPIPVPDFSQGHFFDTVVGLFDNMGGLGTTYVITLTALIFGLDVTFFRNQRAAGTAFKGVPTVSTRDPVIYRISDGKKSFHFYTSNSNRLRSSAYSLESKDKSRTKLMLHKAGVTTPFGGAATAANPRILSHFAKAGLNRAIVKPASGSRAKGILFDVTLEEAYAHMSLNPGDTFMVEQVIRGTEQRIVVLDGRMIAAYTRLGVHVIGDGVLTLDHLVEAKVASQRANAISLPRMKPAQDRRAFLQANGRALTDIPAAGERVMLEDRAFGVPADVIDATGDLSERTAEATVRAAKALGGRFCGADVIEAADGEPFVLELNSRPNLARHSMPLNGPANLNVPEAMIRYHFPKLRDAYRPVARFDILRLRQDYAQTLDVDAFSAADYVTYA